MRVVLDTNVVISGLLWGGPPHRLIDAAIEGSIELFTSSTLLNELREALAYPKLARRVAETGSSVDRTVDRYLDCTAHRSGYDHTDRARRSRR